MNIAPRAADSMGNPQLTGKPQLFDGLAEAELQKLLSKSLLQEYEAGALPVQQGDVPLGVYIVMEGSAKTLRLNEEGEEATIRMLSPGDTCMDAVLFMGGPSPISVQTLTKCKLLLIPQKNIRDYALADAQFAVNILRIVAYHYKGAMQQIDAMQIKPPLRRIGYYFLQKRLEAAGGLEFPLPFRKQIIANYLGMTPETFSRSLKQMRRLGIEAEDDVIRLKDAAALCAFCDADTAALCPRYEDYSACPLRRQGRG